MSRVPGGSFLVCSIVFMTDYISMYIYLLKVPQKRAVNVLIPFTNFSQLAGTVEVSGIV